MERSKDVAFGSVSWATVPVLREDGHRFDATGFDTVGRCGQRGHIRRRKRQSVGKAELVLLLVRIFRGLQKAFLHQSYGQTVRIPLSNQRINHLSESLSWSRVVPVFVL
jgi:hypothetical protein